MCRCGEKKGVSCGGESGCASVVQIEQERRSAAVVRKGAQVWMEEEGGHLW